MLLKDIEAETSRELFQFRKYFGQVKFVVETVKTGSEHVVLFNSLVFDQEDTCSTWLYPGWPSRLASKVLQSGSDLNYL